MKQEAYRIEIPWREEGQVTLQELATELGVDSSNLHKYALKHGFKFFYVLTLETGRRPVLALTEEDTGDLRQRWNEKILGPHIKDASQQGWFYIMSVAPEVPNRVKVGFSLNPDARVLALQVYAPSAAVVDCWPCRKGWERTAIASVTRQGCKQIANEVFDCESVEAVRLAANKFFALMPTLK